MLLHIGNITDNYTDMPPILLTLSKTDNTSIVEQISNTKKSVCFLYKIGSLHKTKGSDSNIILYRVSSYINTMKHTIYNAIHYRKPKPNTFTVSSSFIKDHQKQFNRLYKPYYQRLPMAYPPMAYQRLPMAYQRLPIAYPPLYNTTLFSWPTRNLVFNIMSNPASSIFLQNATSSLHMSTSSNPSFPRIR